MTQQNSLLPRGAWPRRAREERHIFLAPRASQHWPVTDFPSAGRQSMSSMLWQGKHYLGGTCNRQEPGKCASNSATGTRTRVARVRAEYPSQLDYSGSERKVFDATNARPMPPEPKTFESNATSYVGLPACVPPAHLTTHPRLRRLRRLPSLQAPSKISCFQQLKLRRMSSGVSHALP